ncbi:ABC transporter ATP-binding protein [Paludibaculum fermentans]|uniref:ATP-binding cassette domain-containing protein n=1 Tax=Paludibaculum fermentans TaxID=1473598 RepID=A0A7S7NVY5_PALFE|nr:ATP-binding cassette domain-containing protein [Paludibaculum fermentans]QOY90777.1 ATP-binding cassette domain-containing protein [Paludibaculum fermentans]
MPKLIEFENVTIHREGYPALREVTFSIETGEHTAILGPNGSGKSTLIKAITRECYPRYAPPVCRLRIWGKEVWHLFELRSLLGIVTNDLVETCVKPYSAMETALSGFFGSIGIWPNHEVTPRMEEEARKALAFFDIEHLAERKLTEMSSGEQRRAVFARALVHGPKALILDEPTNSLDVRAQREVRDSMRKLAEGGVTVILVTHHLPDIIPEIGRVITLREGRMHSDGSKEQGLRADSLSALFGVDVKVGSEDGYYHMW